MVVSGATSAVAYNVKVDIHELQNCRLPSDAGLVGAVLPNPFVEVEVAGEQRATGVRQQAASAQFNEQLNFTVALRPAEFRFASVEVRVKHAYTFSSALIGVVTFSFDYVYLRTTQHWLYRQWVRLRNAHFPAENIGAILLTVGIFGPGDAIPIVDDQLAPALQLGAGGAEEGGTEGEADRDNRGRGGGGEKDEAGAAAAAAAAADAAALRRGGGNALIHGKQQLHYNLLVSVHRGQDISSAAGDAAGGAAAVPPEPFVRVVHGGFSEATKPLVGGGPDWNAEIQFPIALPLYDDNIVLELYDAAGSSAAGNAAMPALDNVLGMTVTAGALGRTLAVAAAAAASAATASAAPPPALRGFCRLSVERLLKDPMEPTWVNFYCRPDTSTLVDKVANWLTAPAAGGGGSGSALAVCAFAGRVLVSAAAQRAASPAPLSLRAATGAAAADPPIAETVLWVDVYELTCSAAGAEASGGGVRIEVCCGPRRVASKPIRAVSGGGTVQVKRSAGRLDSISLFLPAAYEQAPDIFLYALPLMPSGSSDGTQPLAFCRVPVASLLSFDARPVWRALDAVDDVSRELFAVLATIMMGPRAEAPEKRAARETYKVERYLFRAMIYEAINVPCIAAGSFPDAFCKVELAGKSVRTRAIPDCHHPTWYESFEAEVALPSNKELAPDINIELFTDTSRAKNASLFAAAEWAFAAAGGGSGDLKLGSATFPVSRVPEEWKVYPVWLPLRASHLVQHSRARVLVSFELLERGREAELPFFDDIRPSTLPGDLQLFLLGIRLFSHVARPPHIVVSYGRDIEKSERYLWEQRVGRASSGAGGNWNFLSNVRVALELPKRHVHNAQLEVHVYDAAPEAAGQPGAGGGGGALGYAGQTLLGVAYIQATPLVPWLSEEERAGAKDDFRLFTLDDVIAGTEVPRDAGDEGGDGGTGPKHRRRGLTSRISAGAGVGAGADAGGTGAAGGGFGGGFGAVAGGAGLPPYNDPDRANWREYGFDTTNLGPSATAAAATQRSASSRRLSRLRSPSPPGTPRKPGMKSSRSRAGGGKQRSLEVGASATLGGKSMSRELGRQLTRGGPGSLADSSVLLASAAEPGGGAAAAAGNDRGSDRGSGKKLRRLSTVSRNRRPSGASAGSLRVAAVEAKLRAAGGDFDAEKEYDFDLVMPEIGLPHEEEQRESVDCELEIDLSTEQLPYLSIPLVLGTPTGVPKTVGHLKFLCSIFPQRGGGDQSEVAAQRRQLEADIDWLMEQYRFTRNLTVRVYALAARGIASAQGSTDPGVYLWLVNGAAGPDGTAGSAHEVKDNRNVRRQGLKPQFNKCYTLQCSLPENAVLTLSLMEAGGFRDDLIGSTQIDLEDRWFHPRYQQMMGRGFPEEGPTSAAEDGAAMVPIEQRTLKKEGVTISQGTLRVWIEMLTPTEALSRPAALLASPDPEPFELRVVVWRAKGVPMDDNATSVSFFVRGVIQQDDGTILSQDTDTHFNSRDGTGVFNWRFVWRVNIPAVYTSFKLQIFAHSVIQAYGDPLGECIIDMAYDFAAAKRALALGVDHALPRCWCKCRHTVGHGNRARGLVEWEAVLVPAKKADMFTVGKGQEEPNRAPYLEPVTENRTYVDWKYVGEVVGAATTSLLSTAKYGAVVVVVLLVLGLIFFLIVVLR